MADAQDWETSLNALDEASKSLRTALIDQLDQVDVSAKLDELDSEIAKVKAAFNEDTDEDKAEKAKGKAAPPFGKPGGGGGGPGGKPMDDEEDENMGAGGKGKTKKDADEEATEKAGAKGDTEKEDEEAETKKAAPPVTWPNDMADKRFREGVEKRDPLWGFDPGYETADE